MRGAIHALFVGLFLAVAPIVATADVHGPDSLSHAYNTGTDDDFRVGLQMRLAWAGDYVGPFTGEIDAASLRAIRDFQARHGMEASGVIDENMLQMLVAESDRRQSSAGFQLIDDTATGVRIGLPLALVREVEPTDLGRVWRSEDGGVEIETVRIEGGDYTLAGLHASLVQPSDHRSVTAETLDGRFFTIAGIEDGRRYIMRFSSIGADIRGFAVSYDERWAAEMAPVVTVAANLFDPFGTGAPETSVVAGKDPSGTIFGSQGTMLDSAVQSIAGRSLLAAGIQTGPARGVPLRTGPGRSGLDQAGLGGDDSAPSETRDSSGSGFVVSRDGWVLTNAHVARSCATILVGDHGAADEVVLDDANDLALVHVSGAIGEPLPLSTGVPRLGEDVLALGYPLRSILADSLNVTRGNVSSLLGLMNDARYLQISAPIQPGNSGGPLVDLAGRVVGVVTAKLNAVAVADATGDIPQSINFAIRPDSALRFLEAHDIAFVEADPSLGFSSVADTTARVQDSVLPILCLGGR